MEAGPWASFGRIGLAVQAQAGEKGQWMIGRREGKHQDSLQGRRVRVKVQLQGDRVVRCATRRDNPRRREGVALALGTESVWLRRSKRLTLPLSCRCRVGAAALEGQRRRNTSGSVDFACWGQRWAGFVGRERAEYGGGCWRRENHSEVARRLGGRLPELGCVGSRSVVVRNRRRCDLPLVPLRPCVRCIGRGLAEGWRFGAADGGCSSPFSPAFIERAGDHDAVGQCRRLIGVSARRHARQGRLWTPSR
jgi:hypothetical protein